MLEESKSDKKPCSPLPQVLHKEKSVKDVHPSGGLVENYYVGVKKKVTGNVQPLLFRHRQIFYTGMSNLKKVSLLHCTTES